jgi:Flp pilus assembly protein TadB
VPAVGPTASCSREQRRRGQTDAGCGNEKPNIVFPVLSVVVVVVLLLSLLLLLLLLVVVVVVVVVVVIFCLPTDNIQTLPLQLKYSLLSIPSIEKHRYYKCSCTK